MPKPNIKDQNKCPKCGEFAISVIKFHEPDHLGVIGMAVHSYKTIRTILGAKNRAIDKCCFITEKEFELAR